MKILILGSGGREHTFAWKIAQSPNCESLFIAPGNAGTAQVGQNIAINPLDFDKVKETVIAHAIDVVIVGPEAPLVEGIVDFFSSDNSLKEVTIIGPNKEAAQLEGSKAYAKVFMQENNIPTASYRQFTTDEKEAGLEYIEHHTLPIVLKADGLAAGKGVLICQSKEAAKSEFEAMLAGKFGKASNTVVIEQFLAGIEYSVFILTDGEDYVLLPEAKDYKKIGEGDKGLNTGGMGAISPVSFVDEALKEKVRTEIIEPTLSGLKNRNIKYQGFIFFGLMVVEDQPYVIEYNCRMGDPETEVVFPRIKNDFLDILEAMKQQKLDKMTLAFSEEAAATIILVSGGYPLAYEKGKKISGFEEVKESIIFHAGTKADGAGIYTNGGRVIAVTSLGKDFKEALRYSYTNVEKITFEGKYYRKDIGFDL